MVPALPLCWQVKRLLKKQLVRITSCSPDVQYSWDHSMEDAGK